MEVRDDRNNKPLHFAAKRGHLPVVQHLHEHGAHTYPRNDEDGTPWHIAIFHDQTEVIEFCRGIQRNLLESERRW